MKEQDIRPNDLFNEYLALAAKDAVTYFEQSSRIPIPCPACGGQGQKLLEKYGFVYDECSSCQTFYVNPRPPKCDFDSYYTDAPSTRFWATHFYRQTAASRREHLWKPKAQKIHELISTYGPNTKWLADIGGGYGIFAEEFSKISELPVIVIEPSDSLSSECRQRGLSVIQSFLEELDSSKLPDGPGTFVSFELFEHLHDPAQFLARCYDLLPPDGLLILTTLSGLGLDIRVLAEASKAVFPPHHLNFFNPRSLQQLLEICGFQVLETSTPGKLDVDILENNQEAVRDSFFKAFLRHASDEQKANLQSYLVHNKLSSHMWAVAKKC